MNRIPNAREWAETVRPRDLRLGDLDLYVLNQYDQVLRVLGRRSTRRRNDEPESLKLGAEVRKVLLGLPLVAPIAGIGGVFGGPIILGSTRTGLTSGGLGAGLGVPIVAACFVIALFGPLLVAARWSRSNRRWTTVEIVALVGGAVCGVLSLVGMARVWDVGVTRFAMASVPVWAAVALDLAVLAVIAVASRGRRNAVEQHFRSIGSADHARAHGLVSAMPEGQRATLLAQRSGAIATLRERGLIDAAEASHVESLPLGSSTTIRS